MGLLGLDTAELTKQITRAMEDALYKIDGHRAKRERAHVRATCAAILLSQSTTNAPPRGVAEALEIAEKLLGGVDK